MEVVILPPHVIALNGLNELGEKKLWQKGHDKGISFNDYGNHKKIF